MSDDEGCSDVVAEFDEEGIMRRLKKTIPVPRRSIALIPQGVDETKSVVDQHLRFHGVYDVHGSGSPPWEIVSSPLGGRGVVAARDLQVGDLVLVDGPLVIGPRACSVSVAAPVCVGCHEAKSSEVLRACSRGCRLPVCSIGCESSRRHIPECERLQQWKPRGDITKWSSELLRTVTPIRCLALAPGQRDMLACMQSNYGQHHALEVDLLLNLVEVKPSLEDEQLMRLACCVLDANAFRTHASRGVSLSEPFSSDEVRVGPRVGSLRALFPLGALLNHECTPNTRHVYDDRDRMVMRIARPVIKGQELTVTYTSLLWGTPARRHHLLHTKHFMCRCLRCLDKTEGGSMLSALPCPVRTCPGPILPIDPLAMWGSWECLSCQLEVLPERVTLLQSVLAGLLGTLQSKSLDPCETLGFLEENRHLLPASNHIAVQLKADVVWALGHNQALSFSELSEGQLELKERLCRDLLDVLRKLQTGQCTQTGMLLFELHCTLVERVRRNPSLFQSTTAEILSTVEAAQAILKEDVCAPENLSIALQSARYIFAKTSTNIPKSDIPSTTGTLPAQDLISLEDDSKIHNHSVELEVQV